MFNLNQGLWFYIVNELKFVDSEFKFILLTAGFAIIAMTVGYLLGSINSAIIVSKVLFKEDIRTHGSGNAGLTNMLRTYGKKAALLTLFGDVAKTLLAVVFGSILGGFGYIGGISLGALYCELPLNYMAGFMAIIGHIYPIFYQFKGGKGVLCTAAMALILTPVEFLILIVVFIAIVAMTKYVSLGSVLAASLYPVLVSAHIKVQFGGAQNGVMALITILIAILVVYCHRENLKRIANGTERKLSIGGKKKD